MARLSAVFRPRKLITIINVIRDTAVDTLLRCLRKRTMIATFFFALFANIIIIKGNSQNQVYMVTLRPKKGTFGIQGKNSHT